MKQLYLTLFLFMWTLPILGQGFIVKANQFRDGQELVLDLTIKGEGNTNFPLGSSDFPLRLDASILDLPSATLDASTPSDFDAAVNPGAYRPL